MKRKYDKERMKKEGNIHLSMKREKKYIKYLPVSEKCGSKRVIVP
jgi:hypothetical protein